jgi:hypothetical protein
LTQAATHESRRANTGGTALVLAVLVAAGLFLPASSFVYRLTTLVLLVGFALRCYIRADHVGYAKVALASSLVASQMLSYAFIVLTVALYRDRVLQPWPELRPIRLLAVFGLGSALVNQLVEVNVLAYPFFVLSFFLPIVFFSLFRGADVTSAAEEILGFLFTLLVCVGIVIGLQTMAHWGESPDWRTGGTAHAHMAGILLAFGFAVSFARRVRRGASRSLAERIVLYGALPLIFLADAKYVLAILAASLLVIVGLWFGATKSRTAAALSVLVTMFLIGAFWERMMRVPLILSAAHLGEAAVPLGAALEGFWLTPRGRVLEATLALPKAEPLVFAVGSGPGTFLSRAANSRAYDTMQKLVHDQVGGQREVRSKLPGFIPPFTSWVMRKYALDVIHWSTFEQAPWQSGLVRWVSSLTSLFWEFGLVGFVILLTFYGGRVARGLRVGIESGPRGSWGGFALAGLALFALGVAYFDVWLETPQFAVLQWGMLGLLSGVVED